MTSMSTIYSIRKLRRDGDTIAEIARKTGVSEPTVRKYLKAESLSPAVPVRRQRPSKLDEHRAFIESILDEDERNWRKQRHTSRRIWERLVEERGVVVAECTVDRYVRRLRQERSGAREQFLDLAWQPGEAQADFGECDVRLRGVRTRMSFLVVTFPYSNVGLAQVMPGQNAECVCQGLKNAFEHVGGVPVRIVFDNAAGVGRRVGDAVRTTGLFSAFAAHYGFDYSFCNPNAGHEKGSVENKVGYVRRELLVPVPSTSDLDAFNARLLERSMALSDKPHWIKGESELQLFVEDRFAMPGLPAAPFDVVRYERLRADKVGRVRVGGRHYYSTDPSLGGREVIVGVGATRIRVYDPSGEFVCEHERAYGDAPTDSASPASQLPLLCSRPGAWRNSRVREALGDDLRAFMDGLPKRDLASQLRTMRDETARHGWAATVAAMEAALASAGRVDAASVAVGAARMAAGGEAVYDDPVDLAEYDAATGIGRAS